MSCPAAYQRRRPEESVLYPCIRRCWARVRERCEAEDRPLPNFALVLDGLYVLDAFGEPAFFELPQPTVGELNALVGQMASRVVELLRKRGLWVDVEAEDALAEENPMLAHLAQASTRGTLAFGNGFTRPVRLQDAKPREPGKQERAGTALGFSLDAEVRVSAWNRLHRERLCRYLLRPPLAKGRLTETLEGKVALELKTPWSDGTRVINGSRGSPSPGSSSRF